MGFFIEAERSRQRGNELAAEVTFGPLAQFEFGGIGRVGMLHTMNLLFTKEIGRHASGATSIKIARESWLRVAPLFQPSIEYFGQINGEEADQINIISVPSSSATSIFPRLGCAAGSAPS